MQVALGKLRLASGHFQGRLLAIDPHRVRSHSPRQMRERNEKNGQRPVKMAQTFWVLDADTQQPVCFTTATAAQNVATATPELLNLVAEILQPKEQQILVVADMEHFVAELLADVQRRPSFDLLVPLPNQQTFRHQYQAIPESQFTRRWAGFATTKLHARFKGRHKGPIGSSWNATANAPRTGDSGALAARGTGTRSRR